jgi:hypothetical protein
MQRSRKNCSSRTESERQRSHCCERARRRLGVFPVVLASHIYRERAAAGRRRRLSSGLKHTGGDVVGDIVSRVTRIPNLRFLTNSCSPSPLPPWRPTNQTSWRSCRCQPQPLTWLVLVEGSFRSSRRSKFTLTLTLKCFWFHDPF